AAAGKVGQRRAGVDALVPSGKWIAQRAFYYRRAHYRDAESIALREHQLFAKALGVTVGVRPSPTLRALAADVLEALIKPLLAAMLECGLARRVGVAVVAAKLGVTQLIARFGLHAFDRSERVSNLALEPKRLAPVGAPVFRKVVFVAMAVGAARDVAGRDMHHRGAEPAAELDHVGDAGGVDLDRLFQRGLEVHQARAVDDRVEAARLERLRFFAEQTVIGDVARNDDGLFLDIAIELRAEMFAQRRKHR